MSTCADDDDTFPKRLGCHDLLTPLPHCSLPRVPMSCSCIGSWGTRRPSITLDAYSHLFDTGLGEIGRGMGQILGTRRNEGGKSDGKKMKIPRDLLSHEVYICAPGET